MVRAARVNTEGSLIWFLVEQHYTGETSDQVQKHDRIKKFNIYYDNQIRNTDLQAELERRYEVMVKEEQAHSTDENVKNLLDPVLDPPVQLLPVATPNLAPLLPKLMRKHSEL